MDVTGIVKLCMNENKVNDFEKLIDTIKKIVRSDPNNLSCDIYKDMNDPKVYLFIERWNIPDISKKPFLQKDKFKIVIDMLKDIVDYKVAVEQYTLLLM